MGLIVGRTGASDQEQREQDEAMSADIVRISSDEQPHPPLVEHATCISSAELQGDFSARQVTYERPCECPLS